MRASSGAASRLRKRSVAAGLAVLIATNAAWAAASAQAFRFVPTVQGEMRTELSVTGRSVAAVGAALNVPAGYYVRVGAGVAFGREIGANPRNAGRGEVTVRFLADPFAEWRWGPYAGAGVAMDWRDGQSGRAAVVLVAGTDLPTRARWQPAVEVGVGGGARVAIVLRRARRAGR